MSKRFMDMDAEESYDEPIVIHYENGDEPLHTPEHPYCDDPTCPCTNGLPDYEPNWE